MSTGRVSRGPVRIPGSTHSTAFTLQRSNAAAQFTPRKNPVPPDDPRPHTQHTSDASFLFPSPPPARKPAHIPDQNQYSANTKYVMSPSAIVRIRGELRSPSKYEQDYLFRSRSAFPSFTPRRINLEDDVEIENLTMAHDTTNEGCDPQMPQISTESLISEIHHLRKLNDITNRQLAIVTEQHANAQTTLDIQGYEMNQKIETMEKEFEHIRESHLRDRQDLENQRRLSSNLKDQVTLKDAEIAHLQKMIHDISRDKIELQNKLHIVTAQHERDNITADPAEYEKLLTEKLKSEKKLAKKLSVYEQQIESMRQQIETIKNVKSLLETKCEELQKKLKLSESEVAKLKADLESKTKERGPNGGQSNASSQRNTGETKALFTIWDDHVDSSTNEQGAEIKHAHTMGTDTNAHLVDTVAKLKGYVQDIEQAYRSRLYEMEKENYELSYRLQNRPRSERSIPPPIRVSSHNSVATLDSTNVTPMSETGMRFPPGSSTTWFDGISPSYRSVESFSQPSSSTALEARRLQELLAETQKEKAELNRLLSEASLQREESAKHQDTKIKSLEDKVDTMYKLFSHVERGMVETKDGGLDSGKTKGRPSSTPTGLQDATNRAERQDSSRPKSSIPPLVLEGQKRPSPKSLEPDAALPRGHPMAL